MQEEKKIGFITSASLMLFAGSIDGIQTFFNMLSAIPGIGWISGPPATIFFTFVGGVTLACWFFYLGVQFIGRLGVATLVEFIPAINAIPAYSAATFLTILAANHEQLGGLLRFLTPTTAATKIAGAETAEKVVAGGAQKSMGASQTPSSIKGTSAAEATPNRTSPAFKEPGTNENLPQTQRQTNDAQGGGAQQPSAGEQTDISAQKEEGRRDSRANSPSTPTFQRFTDIRQPGAEVSEATPQAKQSDQATERAPGAVAPEESPQRPPLDAQSRTPSREAQQPERDTFKEEYEAMRGDLPEEMRKIFVAFDLLTPAQISDMKEVVDRLGRAGTSLQEAIKRNSELADQLERHQRRLGVLESQIKELRNVGSNTPELMRQRERLESDRAKESDAYIRAVTWGLGQRS